VTLEIFDEQQHFVRRYSSADKPEPVEKTAAEHPIPMYWVRPTQILSAVAGMHRFAWTCTTTPRNLSGTNFQFPQSCTTRQNIRSERGSCQGITP